MTKKNILLMGIVVLSIFTLVACGGNGDDEAVEENGSSEEQTEIEAPEALNLEGFNVDDAIVIVNGEEITRGDYEAQFERTKQMVSGQYGIDLDDESSAMFLPELQHQTMENLIGQRVLTQEAESKGLEVSEEKLDENIAMLVQQFGGQEGFEEALEADNLTEEDLEQLLYEELMISQLLDAELDFEGIEVSEEEIEEFYAQYETSMEQQGQEVQPLEEIEELIIQQLQQQKAEEEQRAYVSALIDDSDIERLY